jgi:hypothetical protein
MVIPMLLAHICHVSLTCADMATVMPMRSAYYAHAFNAYMPCRPHVRRFGHGYAHAFDTYMPCRPHVRRYGHGYAYAFSVLCPFFQRIYAMYVSRAQVWPWVMPMV